MFPAQVGNRATQVGNTATWVDGQAHQWQPHREPNSPVRIDPEVRFGKPAIAGISTAVIAEHAFADESDEEIAQAFGLSLGQVRWALAYETSLAAA